MATRSGKEAQKSKEVTWSESELAKHILKDKQKPSSVGSHKSSLRSSRGKMSSVGGKATLSSTAPVDRPSSVSRAREKLSSTTTAASSRGTSHGRDGRGGKGGGSHERKKKEEIPARRERERMKGGSRSSEKTRVSGGGGKRGEGRHTTGDRRRGEGTRAGGEGAKDGGRRGGSEHGRGIRQSEGGRDEMKGERREKLVKATSSSSLRENQKAKTERKHPEGATPRPMVEVKEEDGEVVEEEFEYEEAFEDDDDDYKDEDFEEDIEEETESESENNGTKLPVPVNSDPSSHINLVEIMEAINAENRHITVEGGGEGERGEGLDANLPHKPRLEPSLPEITSSTSLGSQRSLTRRKFVDFSSAKKKEESERVARVTRKRGQELLSMIELDVVTFDLFELQPLTEYELYMHSFGSEGTQQVACQTGEDTADVEVQTDTVEERERWVQWPPEDLKGYGGPIDEEEEDTVTMTTGGSSAVRLASFLKRASQVMSVLLEENATHSGESPFQSNQSQIQFCSSRSQIHPPHQLQGCTLTSMEYNPIHPHLVLTIHTPTAEACLDAVPRGGGAVCVWSIREPSQPHYLLVCESAPLCGCFSNHKTTLVLSGNDDGTLVVWDLREPVAMHTRPCSTATPTDHSLIPRAPTFSTAALPNKHNHHSPVTVLTSLTTSTLHTSPLTSDTETETIGLSFQLASLDRSGLLNIWVAVETKPHPQGSESDLGLVPGGRVKLIWSTSVDTLRGLGSSSIPVQSVCVRFHPTDTNHLFVGTDEGTVVHRTRYGRRPIPRQYQSQLETHCPCDITSLSFSPWQPDYFLASYSDGNITLYHIKKACPLVTWSESTNGIAVRQVEWAWHHPGIFLALDTSSNLYIWNLLEGDGEPTGVHLRRDNTPHILSFRLSPPSPSSLSPSPSSPSPSLTLCLSDSTLEIHQLSSNQQPTAVSASQATESQLLSNFTNYLHTL